MTHIEATATVASTEDAASLSTYSVPIYQQQTLLAFVRFAEFGSFASVVEELGVPTSVITRVVGILETHLNPRLLNRTTPLAYRAVA